MYDTKEEKPIHNFNGFNDLEMEKCMYMFKILREKFELNLWNDKSTWLAGNQNSGYAWIYGENLPVSFYMPINCDLVPSDIYVLWTNPEDGEEIEESLANFSNMDGIYSWVEELAADENN